MLSVLIWLGCAVASLHLILVLWKVKRALFCKPAPLSVAAKNILEIVDISNEWRVLEKSYDSGPAVEFDKTCRVPMNKGTVKLHGLPIELRDGELTSIREAVQNKVAADAAKVSNNKLLACYREGGS